MCFSSLPFNVFFLLHVLMFVCFLYVLKCFFLLHVLMWVFSSSFRTVYLRQHEEFSLFSMCYFNKFPNSIRKVYVSEQPVVISI